MTKKGGDPSAYASGWHLKRWKLKKGWRKRRHSERSASGAKNPGDPSAYVSGWQCDGHSDPEPKPWAYAKGLRRGRIPSLFHHSDFSIIECLHSGQPFVAFIPNNERMSSRNLFPIGNFRRKIFSWQRYYFLWYKNEVSGKFVVRHHYLIFDKFGYTFYRNINVLSVLLR